MRLSTFPRAPDHPFIVGAVYNRQRDIHERFGGQRQYGIATPSGSPFIFLFSGSTGHRHGYFDKYDDDGVFLYFGEGQLGDMRMTRGNLAIQDHIRNGRRLLVFKSLGEGLHRYVGEFVYSGHELRPNLPDSEGRPRIAIVFRLQAISDDPGPDPDVHAATLLPSGRLSPTERVALVNVRASQQLFRRNVSLIEQSCRLTHVQDLRFLRASHIKPWRDSSEQERVDLHNGLLLTPSADLLFDQGWVSFTDNGRLLVSERFPTEVKDRLGIDLTVGRRCGEFSDGQKSFLEYHRDCVFERSSGLDPSYLLD